MTTSYKDDTDIHTDNLAASAHQAKHLTIFNDFFWKTYTALTEPI